MVVGKILVVGDDSLVHLRAPPLLCAPLRDQAMQLWRVKRADPSLNPPSLIVHALLPSPEAFSASNEKADEDILGGLLHNLELSSQKTFNPIVTVAKCQFGQYIAPVYPI